MALNIWIDDLRPAPEGFVHVHTLADLRALLASSDEPIEVMSFDHDLGDGEPDGYDIIKWIVDHHLDRYPAEIRTHSANPTGAENIAEYDRFVRRRLLSGELKNFPDSGWERDVR
ncbi:MAG: cyclic-phosphate processing receiver domain-containing protein [Patescibacteria group bacterium]